MADKITYERGEACNPVKIGGVTELYGDPEIKIEKPHTIIRFPGGHVEIARTQDNQYWVHVATRDTEIGGERGQMVDIRLSAEDRYLTEANDTLRREIETGGVSHFAVRVAP